MILRRLRIALPLAACGTGLALLGTAAGGIASLDSPLATAAAVQKQQQLHRSIEVSDRHGGCWRENEAIVHRDRDPEL